MTRCKDCAEYGSEFCKHCEEFLKEDAPTNAVAQGAVALPPDAKFKPQSVVDRRRRKDKEPVLLKRFRQYIEDHKAGKVV